MRSEWRKPPLSLVLCVVVIALLGACAGSGAPTPEPATIKFSHGEGQKEHFEDLAKQFGEQYSNITINLIQDQVDEADCFVGPAWGLPDHVQKGEVLALDALLEEDFSFDRADFYPGALGLFQRNGKLWGIPGGVDVLMMYYNQDLFDKAGVPIPQAGWTWNDFLTATMAISKPDDGVFGYAAPQRADAFDAVLFVYQHGGRLFDSLNTPTTTTFDDPLTIEAVDWYARLINEHNVAPTAKQVRELFGSENWALFRGIQQGRIGTWIGFFSERGGRTWPTEWEMRWGMALLPADATEFTGGTVDGYSIAANTPYPEACWQWISFLSRQLPAGTVPARKSVALSDVFTQQVGKDVATSVRAAMQSAVLVSPEAAAFGNVLGIFYQGLQSVIEGNATAEEAMTQAQRQAAAFTP
jgi:multiple sugar transport system substrate-binding protein